MMIAELLLHNNITLAFASLPHAHTKQLIVMVTLPGVLPDALSPSGGHSNWRLSEPGGDQGPGL